MTAARRSEAVDRRLSPIRTLVPDLIAAATLVVETAGQGFSEIIGEAARFVAEAGAKDGALVAEHRARPHRREIVLQFVGRRR